MSPELDRQTTDGDDVSVRDATVLETSTGTLLGVLPPGAGPCPSCLEARVREAGFELRGPPGPAEIVLPARLRTLLHGPRRGPAANVLRIVGARASRHALLPYPGCPRCPARPSRPDGPVALWPEALGDPLLGITSGQRSRMQLEASGTWLATGRVHVDPEDGPVWSSGRGGSPQAAREAQLGEAVERYALFHPDPGTLVLGAARDMPPGSLAPGGLAPFTVAQRQGTGYVDPGSSLPLAWIPGRSLRGDRRALVPAAAVFLCRRWRRDEPRFAPCSTTGVAAHPDAQQALHHAVLELVERLAVTLAWHRGTLGCRLPGADLLGDSPWLVPNLERAGLELLLGDVSSPAGIPVVTATLLGSGYPHVTVGAAAGLTLQEAALGASGEALSLWTELAEAPRSEAAGGPIPPEGGPRQHVLHWCTPEGARRLRGAFRPAEPGRRAPPVTAGSLVERLLALAPEAVVVDLTPVDVAWSGFHVLRVVAPGLPYFRFGALAAPLVDLARFGLADAAAPHPFG